MTLPAEFSAGCHIAIVITLVIMVINIVIIMVISMVLSMIIIMVLLMVIIIMVIIIMVIIIMVIIMVIIIMVIIMVTIIMVILIIFIADYTGFPTLGLFSISRHPNYLAEQVLIIFKYILSGLLSQLLWVVYYLFSVAGRGHWLNPSITGSVLLILLFQVRILVMYPTSCKYPQKRHSHNLCIRVQRCSQRESVADATLLTFNTKRQFPGWLF